MIFTRGLLRCMSPFMARNGPQAMSAVWSLAGGKRTWQGKLISVAIDPSRTFAVSIQAQSAD
jgi:hypothetical protein